MITREQGKASFYIINSYNTANKQIELARRFCKNNIEIGKMYISQVGENTDKYYELIKDIRNKNMDILVMSIFTIFSMNEAEKNMIIHLCRKNNILYIEI